jgi:hypothetical protein
MPNRCKIYEKYYGGALRESCLADYICIHALLDKDDISDFISDFEKHTDSKIGIRKRITK